VNPELKVEEELSAVSNQRSAISKNHDGKKLKAEG